MASTDDPYNYIIVEWDYLEALEVKPDHFEILFDGELVNTSPYRGLTGDYSWITEADCGTTHEVIVVAVNGADMAPTEPVMGGTPAC